MELNVQKRMAAQVLRCSPKRVVFDSTQLAEIKDGITKGDIRSLIKKGFIQVVQKRGISRFRAKARQSQQKKGRQRGHGSRKGTANARLSQKVQWMNRIRLQRVFLSTLKSKNAIAPETYYQLYMKAKGGFFRSIRHLKIYMTENKLFKGI